MSTRWSPAKWIVGLWIVIAIYALPYLLTWISIGPTEVPLIFAPDLFLYLGLAGDLRKGSEIILRTQYAYFPGAFHLFNAVDLLTNHKAYVTVLLNQLAWASAIFILSASLLRKLYPEFSQPRAREWLVVCACLQFCLINYSAVPGLAGQLVHAVSEVAPPQLSGTLPFNRQFFPQIVLPFLLAYFVVGLELQRAGPVPISLYASLTILELVCFWTFPYAAIFAVLVLGCFALACWPVSGGKIFYRAFVSIVLAGVANLLYLAWMHTLHPSPNGGSLKFGAEWFLPALRYHFHSGTFALQATLGIGFIAWGVMSGAPRRVFVGSLCFVESALLVLDGVVRFPLALSHHFTYFSPFTLGLLGSALFLEGLVKWRPEAIKFACIVMFWACSVIGSSFGVATFDAFAATNRRMQAQFKAVDECRNGGRSWETIVAPAKYVDDAADWLPFMFGGRTLFSRQADLFYPVTIQGTVTSPEYYSRKAAHLVAYDIRPDQVEFDVRHGDLNPYLGMHARFLYGSHYLERRVLANQLETALLPSLELFTSKPSSICPLLVRPALLVSEATSRINTDALKACGEIVRCATFHGGEVFLLTPPHLLK